MPGFMPRTRLSLRATSCLTVCKPRLFTEGNKWTARSSIESQSVMLPRPRDPRSPLCSRSMRSLPNSSLLPASRSWPRCGLPGGETGSLRPLENGRSATRSSLNWRNGNHTRVGWARLSMAGKPCWLILRRTLRIFVSIARGVPPDGKLFAATLELLATGRRSSPPPANGAWGKLLRPLPMPMAGKPRGLKGWAWRERSACPANCDR